MRVNGVGESILSGLESPSAIVPARRRLALFAQGHGGKSVLLREQLCETKPICPMGKAVAGVKRAEQSQFAQGDAEDKYFMKKKLWRIDPANGLGETNPISRADGMGKSQQGCRCRLQGNHVKQSQFPPARPYPEGDPFHAKQSQFPGSRPARRICNPLSRAGHAWVRALRENSLEGDG